MKRAIYSYAAKTIAFILLVASAAFGSYKTVDLLTDISTDYETYRFESNFYESNAFDRTLLQPFIMMLNMEDYYEDNLEQIRYITARSNTEYYVSENGNIIFSNTDNTNPEYFQNAKYSLIMEKSVGSTPLFSGSMMNKRAEEYILNYSYRFEKISDSKELKIYVKADEEYIEDISADWYAGQKIVKEALIYILSSILIFIFSLVYLLCTAGRSSKDDKIHMLLIDRMFVELNIGIILLSCFGVAAIAVSLGDSLISDGRLDDIFIYIISFIIGAGAAFETTLLMSLVRNLKNRTFLKYSLILRSAKFLWELAKKLWAYIKKLVKRTTALLRSIYRMICHDKLAAMTAAAFTIYTFLIVILGMMLFSFIDYGGEGFFVFLLIAGLFATAMYYILKNLNAFDKIKDGIFKIRSGNLDHKITGVESGITGELAEAVNNIGDGLSESVKTKIRAERMKAELITNVSHDLKTPLTSIINYTKLLSDMDLKPDEANDYVSVLKGKSERLKNLTQDLFDISKAQSGNEQVNFEKLDISLLISQTLGELDEMIKASGLSFVPDLKVSAYVNADGKKMSRVFENLIGNAVKYSMKNTRVYISCVIRNKVVIEIKNISAYPLDFNVKEITERFVRGDESRTAEGNGLGLAIVKSYVELCGGNFEIITDGDLFKARILFDKA